MTGRAAIHVGATAPQARSRAVFLDGVSAVPAEVEIHLDDDRSALVVNRHGSVSTLASWPFDAIRALKDQADDEIVVLYQAPDGAARLLVPAEMLVSLAARCHRLYRGRKAGRWTRIIPAGLAAVASVAALIFFLVPALADRLATLLPPEGEAALGEETYERIRTALSSDLGAPLRICEAAPGQTALEEMVTTLTTGMDLPQAVRISVLDSDLINAFALPGGQVVLFRGLIEAAETPDEVAAVVAHEIGHVAARDPTRLALRSAGSIGILGLILGDFAGGAVVLFLVNQLINADYSQAAEAQADAFATDRLIAAGISPAALADFFDRLQAEHGESSGVVSHFSSHPELGDRAATARAAAQAAGGDFLPSLSGGGWAALQAICDQ